MSNDDFYDLLETQVTNVIDNIINDPLINLESFQKDFQLSLDYLEVFSLEETFSNILYQLELDLEYHLAHYNICTISQQQALRLVYELIKKYK